ncbi:hypothetical protein DL95DRAFT_413569 [Leptodontidium sp. 2 PMI_412]|nr:hypothetical protein DL95DRAFT_413569 [Leptodontidium sp. 2 PMI_412]
MAGARKVHPSSKKDEVKPQCHECDKLRSRRHRYYKKHGHQQKDKPKYCASHSCSIVGRDKSQCWNWKSKYNEHCGSRSSIDGYSDSPPPPVASPPTTPLEPMNCDSEHCRLPRFHDLPYCELHSCLYSFCRNYADPTQGRGFCNDHKCSMISCQIVRKANRDGDHLVLAFFCNQHECKTDNCHGSKVPGKNHCHEHCCKVQNCPSAHETVLERYCLEHFREKVKIEGATDKEAEITTMLKEREKKAAEKAQEDRDAAERRDREAEEKKLRIDKMKLEEDLKEEKRKREWLAAEREREREMGTRVREDKKYHPARPFATSPRNSGSNVSEKPEQNPHVKHTYNDRHNTPSSSPNREYATQTPYRNIPKGGTKRYEDNRGRAENSQPQGHKRWSGDTFVDSGPHHEDAADDRGRDFTTDSSESDSGDDGYLRPPGANNRTRASSTASTVGSSVGPGSGPAPGSRDEYFRYRPEGRRGDYHTDGKRWTLKKEDDPVPVYNYGHHEKREMERERKSARENTGERGGRTGERMYNHRENVGGERSWRKL